MQFGLWTEAAFLVYRPMVLRSLTLEFWRCITLRVTEVSFRARAGLVSGCNTVGTYGEMFLCYIRLGD